MNKALSITHDLLTGMGVPPQDLRALSAVTLVSATVIGALLVYWVLRRLVEPAIDRLTRRTSVKWDDIVFRHNAVRWVWILISAMMVYYALPSALAGYAPLEHAASVVVQITLVLTIMMLVIEGVKSAFLLIADRDNVDDIARQMRMAHDNGEDFDYKPSHSLKGLQQMLSIIIAGIAVVLIVSILLGKNPLIIFSGLSAGAAVLMLVFQDSILGVVAGVQLTANEMLQPGDWISVPKYGANGIVREVTLATVKVQNWDKTIVTIPPYHLISEGFQNWRGMQDSGGRRIMRSICIDMLSVRRATPDEVARWSQQPWWRKYPEQADIVNLTAFRRYLEDYITRQPNCLPSMLFMVRELDPTPYGLPVEVYFFTSSTEWKSYEIEQADLLDNILATVHDFGLRVAQRPICTHDAPVQAPASAAEPLT